jgi:adenine-specific DNA-methyltransferase
VVEIVRPGRSLAREGELPGLGTRRAGAHTNGRNGNGSNGDVRRVSSSRPAAALPENRLIWTNDNLVALRTLLDEKDEDNGYRYREKVDLVYIDPPFMVQSDFLAENSIDVELDEDAHVEAKKEPSLVEILAYKDTWRQGLDSFLSMLRERLLLLKDLLSATGTIYVHLDWHAVHYVKVLMDELFGYEHMLAEITWKRANARAGSSAINHIHDTLLAYGVGPHPYYAAVRLPHEAEYVRSHYRNQDKKGRYRLVPLNAPGPSNGITGQPWRGYLPPKGRHWSHTPDQLEDFVKQGKVQFPTKGKNPELKQYLNEYEGIEIQSVWTDIPPVNPQAIERLGYPTQKPVALIERIIKASCPSGGLVLDCFVGSGTTAEAAERLGRRWIAIDNGKFAVHLARKRLIQLHDQPKQGKPAVEYVECDVCKNIARKDKTLDTREKFNVRPFTVENIGVYQRAEQWQDFQTQRSRYRDEMIRVFGGEVVNHSPLLHGRKGNAWVHVGPLDGPVTVSQVWSIARDAQRSGPKAVTILSADYNTLSASENEEIKAATGVAVTIRIIPASAIDEVRRRLEIQRRGEHGVIESMAIPAFYAPLSIVLRKHVSRRLVKVMLDRCDVDIDSFIGSQRPALKPISGGMSPAAERKAKAEIEKWRARQEALEEWLSKATTWQKFIDFWAIDWDYGRRVGEDDKPIFETDWQSFRTRRSTSEVDPIAWTAEFEYDKAGEYRVAARVTDVFGNDGIATMNVKVG